MIARVNIIIVAQVFLLQANMSNICIFVPMLCIK